MKAARFIIVFLALSLTGLIFAQDINESSFFSKIELGFYGGVNTSNSSDLGGSANFDFKTDLTSNLNLKISIAYYHMSTDYAKNVKSYSVNEIQGEKFFTTDEFNIHGRDYENIPISLGLQYTFYRSDFSPYLITEVGYNMIDAKSNMSPSISYSYNSLEEIPDGYKHYKAGPPLPLSSFRYAIGIGTVYDFTNFIDLDVRYLYNFDSELTNTHQLLFGFVL